MNTRLLIIGFSLAAAAGLGIALYAFYPAHTVSPIRELFASNGASAEEIVAACAQEGDRSRCYEHAVPALYPQKSIPELLSLVREIRSKDSSYQFCHVLAHKLGEIVVAEDPNGWLDAIPLNPNDGLCSNGFVHGVIVGRFRNDVLDEKTLTATIPDFKRACEPREMAAAPISRGEPRSDWHPSPLDQAICYHGMGHLFMFITNADIPRALSVCDIVGKSPTGDFMRVCREGVFMQIYQPLEPDDFALVELLPEKPTADNYRRLCAVYPVEARGACLREAWPLFDKDIRAGTGAAKFCADQPNAAETHSCYETVAAIVGRMSLGNSAKAATACGHFPSDRQSLCYIATAQAVLEEDRTRAEKAIELCDSASETVARECIEALARRASFIFSPGSPDKERFCALVAQRGVSCSLR